MFVFDREKGVKLEEHESIVDDPPEDASQVARELLYFTKLYSIRNSEDSKNMRYVSGNYNNCFHDRICGECTGT
jgi:endonuclease I